MPKITALVLFMVVMLTGCHTLHQRYDLEVPEIKTATVKNLTVGVQDEREYVRSNARPEQYVGMNVGAFGAHFPFNAANDQPLADVFAERIQKGLGETGVDVKRVRLPLQMKKDDAIKALSSMKQKSVLITLYDWKTISVYNTKLFYDIEIAVYDAEGRPLVKKHLKGIDVLGNDGMTSIDFTWRIRSAALMEKIEQLFSIPEIARQL